MEFSCSQVDPLIEWVNVISIFSASIVQTLKVIRI